MSNFNFTITWLHNRRQKDGNDGNREETTKQNDLLTQTKKNESENSNTVHSAYTRTVNQADSKWQIELTNLLHRMTLAIACHIMSIFSYSSPLFAMVGCVDGLVSYSLVSVVQRCLSCTASRLTTWSCHTCFDISDAPLKRENQFIPIGMNYLQRYKHKTYRVAPKSNQ